MGEYWAPCNMTKREKYCCHGSIKTHGKLSREMLGAIWILILSGRWDKTDEIRLCSDYDGESRLDPETFEVLEEYSGPGIGQDGWYDLPDVFLLPADGDCYEWRDEKRRALAAGKVE